MSKKNNTIIQEQDIIEFAEALEHENIKEQIETLKMRQAELEMTRNTNRLYLSRIQQQRQTNSPFEQYEPFFTKEEEDLHAAKLKEIHEKRIAEDALKVFDEHVFGFDDQTSFNKIVDSQFGDKVINRIKKKSKEPKSNNPTRRSTRKRKKIEVNK